MIGEKTCFIGGQGLFQGDWKNQMGTKWCLKEGWTRTKTSEARVQ